MPFSSEGQVNQLNDAVQVIQKKALWEASE